MNMPQSTETIDVQALIKEVGGEIDVLIKNEKERLEALKKGEESKAEESKKEESKVEKNDAPAAPAEMKKDEGSGFESPAPEASSSPAAEASPSPEAPPADPSAEGDSGESLQSMVQSLDDQMLQELMQVVQMEMEARSQAKQPDMSASAPAPSPEASAPAPDMGKMEMAYKKEMEAMNDKLAKSEKQVKEMEGAFTAMTDLLDKMVNRPVSKAVTDIRSVEYADKGEKDLKKAEQANISDEDLKKRLTKMASDRQELAKLSKNEREVLSNFFVTKKRTPEVLKLISK